jgi:hypothetical protein
MAAPSAWLNSIGCIHRLVSPLDSFRRCRSMKFDSPRFGSAQSSSLTVGASFISRAAIFWPGLLAMVALIILQSLTWLVTWLLREGSEKTMSAGPTQHVAALEPASLVSMQMSGLVRLRSFPGNFPKRKTVQAAIVVCCIDQLSLFAASGRPCAPSPIYRFDRIRRARSADRRKYSAPPIDH